MELKHTAQRDGRLSSFLREEMGMSAGLINKMKWQNKLFVNGIPQHADFSVKRNDVITVPLEEETPEYPAESGALDILYEDEHLLAVDKLPGMLIHPSRSQFTGTLANRVLGYFQQSGQQSAFHPVTRLDRDTFGIVLVTKNSHVHALMQETPLQKTYHALVRGGPAEDQGQISAPIARKPLPSLLREIRPDGKESITKYRVLARYEDYSKLALIPVTGRTHQLRLHCAHMGFPILGDPQYGAGAADFGLDHQLLCAKRLEFNHPITGEQLVLESKMDACL